MKSNDVLSVTIVEQFAAGVLAAAFALVAEPIPAPEQFADPLVIGSLCYVALLSASFGAIAQNVAQAHIPPAEAGILCSLESVFCAIFSVLLFGEVLTVQSVIGFVLIFFAIMLAQRRGV
jgi:drug/metabolite transporter (DMT)-like permease